ncbi:uncharacterized protein G2W53_041802 [Senna tora]|uniref:Uncharacterized protein n=1 Tax=Senna tora TaxID=362788 RepID=A0A834SGA5_9FABA|nr:uncharacterized protein G2W53_041802 [Senna tora]
MSVPFTLLRASFTVGGVWSQMGFLGFEEENGGLFMRGKVF